MEKPEVAAKEPIHQSMNPGTYWWCACGRSLTQPFCDGSHAGTSFTPLEVTLNESQNVWWCQCKHSGNPPYCDGSHHTV